MTVWRLPRAGPPPKLLARVRAALRTRHYSRTEEAYVSALLFLYKQVLVIELAAVPPVVRARWA